MSVKLISVTPDAEKIIGYCARVSNPKNQDNPDVSKLLKYCIKNAHWSIFEQAFMTFEIETGCDIAPQILRHKSFNFQQFSLRYSEAMSYVPRVSRRQDTKNRQNSIDDLSEDTKQWFIDMQDQIWSSAYSVYLEALSLGISKESARALLPMNTRTKMYMSGSVRSFIHYIQVRTEASTQKEHRDIAEAIKAIFVKELPITSSALGWTSQASAEGP